MNPNVDQYLTDGCMRCKYGGTSQCKVNDWRKELEILRSIVLDCGLTEELKWGVPCYTYAGNNVLLVSAFKEFCAVSFFKGSLLNDSRNILEKPGKNSQATRYAKFTGTDEIMEKETVLKAYIFEAVEAEKAGLKVEFKKNPEPIPEELQQKLNEDPFFKTAFEELTPGRQRGYILYFSQPKKPETRAARIKKYTPGILNGEGLHDKYKVRSGG